MKYAFIINPASGHGKYEKELMGQIEALIEAGDKDVKIYYTEGEKDATVLADAIAKAAGDEDVVVFACGGDGTIHEVANGLVGNDNAILAVVPVGSGNDYVRALGGGGKKDAKFLDMNCQMNGEVSKSDLIKMTYMNGDEEVTRYTVNGLNIGFDGNAAMLSSELRKNPMINGTFSYVLAVVALIARKEGGNVKITVDGTEFYEGPMLLTTIGNGGFCGGGFESCPYADIGDGLAEVFTVRDIKRRDFVKLVPKYKVGKIFEVKDIEKFTKYTRAKEIVIEPLEAETMKFVADGEFYETGVLKLEMVQHAINVMVPEEV